MKITEICEGNTSYSQPQKSHVNASLVSLSEHIKRQVPLCDSIFRYQSEAYFDTFKTAKKLREAGSLPELDWESEEMLGTDIGESVELKGVGRVWLDVPYLNEGQDPEPKQEIVDKFARTDAKTRTWYIGQWAERKGIDTDDAMHMAGYIRDGYMGSGAWNWRYVGMGESVEEVKEAEYQGKKVELSKPKRGGSKKFYVYVTDPKTKNVKKVSFGADSGGGKLAVKLKDPKARKAFADRHNCDQKNDKTKAGYWSCRLPRYAKSLGLSGGGTWW